MKNTNDNNISIFNVLKTLTQQAGSDLVMSVKAGAAVSSIAVATGSIVVVDGTGVSAQYVADHCNKASKNMLAWVNNKYVVAPAALAVLVVAKLPMTQDEEDILDIN